MLFGVGIAACLAVACADDDDGVGGGKSGSAGKAGMTGEAGSAGSAGKTGDGGSKPTAGTPGKGGDENRGGMPGAGMPGEPGGSAGEPPELGFSDFVHDLIENQTGEDNAPTPVKDRQFSDPQDEHGHYLVPESSFGDLF
jgi:hypothetical protein